MGFLTDLPAYIPSRNFALALMHVVAGTGSDGSAGELTLEGLKTNVQLLPEGRLKQGLLVALAESKGDLDRARVSLEAWFDGTMDRVSGWYKRETSWILFGVGLFTAVALNINTLQIAQDLSSNNTLRQALIAHVSTVYKDLDTSKVKLPEEKLKEEEKGLSDVIGYSALKEKRHTELENEAQADPSLTTPEARASRVQIQMEDWSSWFSYWLQTVIISLPGWFISALAISLGAPFWFDILNQLMVVRSTVKPYEKSQSEGSADRGNAQSHGDLLKQAQVAALTAVGPAQGGGIQAAGGVPAVAVPGFMPLETNVRLAFDLNGADPTSLALTKNGTAVTVPPDGMIELPLEIGISHELLATATKAGQQVSWSKI